MAVLTFDATASFATTNNLNAYPTASFTPAANDELIAFCSCTGASGSTGSVTDSLGGTWTQIAKFTDALNGKQLYLFARDQLSNGSALVATFNCTGTPTGGAMVVYRVANGPSQKTGAAAIRQSAGQSAQTAATTPAPAFGSSALSINPVVGAVALGTNPAGMTPPATFTEDMDTGFGTPVYGIEAASVQSGFTGTTVTWGSAPATTYCDVIAEIDLSLTVSPTAIASGEAWGSPTVTQQVNPAAIASAEAFGVPFVTLQVQPVAIGSAEAWGIPTVSQLVQPVGIGSLEGFGSPTVTQLVAPVAIGTAETWGIPSVTQLVQPAAIAAAEAWGAPTLKQLVDLSGAGISTAEAWGAPTVGIVVNPQSVAPVAIGTVEAWGVPTVGSVVADLSTSVRPGDLDDRAATAGLGAASRSQEVGRWSVTSGLASRASGPE